MPRRLALAALIAFAAAAPAAAAPGPPPSAERARLEQSAQVSRTQAAQTEAEIAKLRGQLVELGAAEAAGEHRASDKKARLDQLNVQESAVKARIGENQNAVARLLGALELYRRNPPPALLVFPSSAKDAVRAQILARALALELQSGSKALADQAEQIRRLRRAVESASEDLFRSESDIADQRGKIERLIADKTQMERSLTADAEASEAALRALARKARNPGDLARSLPQDPAADAAPPPTGFIAPVQGPLVTRYGQAGERGRAQGMTWRAAPGAPVLSPVAASVEYAGPLKGWGVILILRSGGAYDIVLAGLQTTREVVGRTVAAGEPVGRMADDATSPLDLYLEVRHDGEAVDPARWLAKAAH